MSDEETFALTSDHACSRPWVKAATCKPGPGAECCLSILIGSWPATWCIAKQGSCAAERAPCGSVTATADVIGLRKGLLVRHIKVVESSRCCVGVAIGSNLAHAGLDMNIFFLFSFSPII